MKCPECGTWTEVLETRKHGENGKRRRYECANEHRFTTLEQVVDGISVQLSRRTARMVQGNAKGKKTSLPSEEVRPSYWQMGRLQEGSREAEGEGLHTYS
jgi:hypothetical protein